jgi:hypothetical protein
MKIIFLCGTLAPGKDGVGDYTRCLAAELMRQGHQVSMIALKDRFVNEQNITTQESGGVAVPVLRLPKKMAVRKRFASAESYIAEFDPEWLSLQYVPFSFQDKGLPFGLKYWLAKLGRGRKWHVMFHELWVGISIISPLKHKVLGFFQRIITQLLVFKLQPELVTTTNILYQLVLKSGGINATILSLFSNIPKVEMNLKFRKDVISLLSIQEPELERWVFTGVFGSLYQANLESVLKSLLEESNKNNKKIGFLSFGRLGIDGNKELSRLENLFSGKIRFANLGEQSAERVSTLLQLLNIGISCTPSQHIGKSGVYASMKLHGLDVLMSGGEVIPEYEDSLLKYMPEFVNRTPEMWGVEYVAKNFIFLLNNSKS